MLYLVICGEVQQMKPLTTARTLHLPYSSTPPHNHRYYAVCYFFILKEVGHTRSDLA